MKKLPVMEIFGPTIAGEGNIAGQQTMFVRFGGCDYRCSWCDSMHAVLPELVRENAEFLTSVDIVERLLDLEDAKGRHLGALTPWISLSGGNPALLDLTDLIDLLQDKGYNVNIETQGSKWKDWFHSVESLTVSPKPPSSGMVIDKVILDRILTEVPNSLLKIVVFDEVDLEFAKYWHSRHPLTPLYLSCGTKPTDDNISLGERYKWLCETVIEDRCLSNAIVLLQLHVIAWGHRQGV